MEPPNTVSLSSGPLLRPWFPHVVAMVHSPNGVHILQIVHDEEHFPFQSWISDILRALATDGTHQQVEKPSYPEMVDTFLVLNALETLHSSKGVW